MIPVLFARMGWRGTDSELLTFMQSISLETGDYHIDNRAIPGMLVVDVHFVFDEARARRVIGELESEGRVNALEWSKKYEYSVEDIEAAPAAMFTVGNEYGWRSGTPCKTQYDFSKACAECGVGRVQVGPLRAALPKKINPGPDLRLTRDGDFLVKDSLASKLRALPGGELHLASIEDRTGKSISGWQQLRPSKVLPPFSDPPFGTRALDTSACVCKRSNWRTERRDRFVPAYRQDTLNALPLVSEALERFSGSFRTGRTMNVATPELVIRRDALALLRTTLGNNWLPVQLARA